MDLIPPEKRPSRPVLVTKNGNRLPKEFDLVEYCSLKTLTFFSRIKAQDKIYLISDEELAGYIGHRKFGIKASLAIIKRAEEQAKGVPKSLAFNLLNILVDLKTQAESNISGQNGKKPLDKNILTAIQSHLATYFGWDEETTLKNWKKEPVNLQQRIADKCRNLNEKKAK